MNKDERLKIAEDMDRIKFKLVEAAEQVIDVVTAGFRQRTAGHNEPGQKTPANIARRQVANLLRVSQFCANRACRRSQCCRGEPLHCLQSVIPLLPPEAFVGLLKKKRKGRITKLFRQARQ